MAEATSLPRMLSCPWCEWKVLVSARGMSGNDPGSGVEAARLGERHAIEQHGRTWQEFLTAEPSAE